jgi:hypothetical protein
MTHLTQTVFVAMAALALTPAAAAQQTTSSTHAQHLDAKGKQVMGFDQTKTTHHFFLYEDGGAVDVSVKDPANKTDLDAIRSHLPHIAKLFGQGDFEAPMLVHDRKDVPGTKDLARLKDKVTYAYVETRAGGRVDIVTSDKEALAAVHAFLRFQIEDHHTGDRTTPAKRKQ